LRGTVCSDHFAWFVLPAGAIAETILFALCGFIQGMAMEDAHEDRGVHREHGHPTYWKVRNRLLSGVLLLVPFVITLMVLLWFFGRLRVVLRPIVRYLLFALRDVAVVDVMPEVVIRSTLFVLSLLLLLGIIYIVGVIGQKVIGRRFVGLLERVVLGIPLARNVYRATKQVIDAVSLKPGMGFQSVVLLEFPRLGYKTLGFVTGRFDTGDGRNYLRLFIPTTPNATTGFMEIVPADEVVETDLTIEEAFKTIISGGLVAPDRLGSYL